MFDDSRAAFARQASLIRARLLAGTILASDETSMRVGKQNWWAWVFHHADSACFVIHPNRSRAVVEGFLGNDRPDFWVSDRLASQMGWAKKDHQVCLAHLIREAKYASEAGDSVLDGDRQCPAVRTMPPGLSLRASGDCRAISATFRCANERGEVTTAHSANARHLLLFGTKSACASLRTVGIASCPKRRNTSGTLPNAPSYLRCFVIPVTGRC